MSILLLVLGETNDEFEQFYCFCFVSLIQEDEINDKR